jgi:hypothetical protein
VPGKADGQRMFSRMWVPVYFGRITWHRPILSSCGHSTIRGTHRTGILLKSAISRDTAVFWPGQAEPTMGRENHKAESIDFFKTFPDNHLINHPYKVEIAQGEWTCTVADFTGTMLGPMKGPDGKLIAPTNKKFHIEFCTVAHWKNGEIVEEKIGHPQTRCGCYGS